MNVELKCSWSTPFMVHHPMTWDSFCQRGSLPGTCLCIKHEETKSAHIITGTHGLRLLTQRATKAVVISSASPPPLPKYWVGTPTPLRFAPSSHSSTIFSSFCFISTSLSASPWKCWAQTGHMQTLEHLREEGEGEESQWQRGGMIECITFSRFGWRSAWSCRRSWRWWQRPKWLDSAVVPFLCKICMWKEECNTITLFWPVTRAQGKYYVHDGAKKIHSCLQANHRVK